MNANIRDRDQLVDAIARIVFSTPPEFFIWDEIDIDLGHEIIVDQNPDTQWYPGCDPVLQEESVMVIRIPIRRKASVYEYHADQMDDEIKDTEGRVVELKMMQELYRSIADSERRRKEIAIRT